MFEFTIGTYTNSAKLRSLAMKTKKKINQPLKCYIAINADTYAYGIAPALFRVGTNTKYTVVFLHSVVDLAREGLIDIYNATLADYYVCFTDKAYTGNTVKLEYDMINVLRYKVDNADDECYTRNLKIAKALKGERLL